MNTTDDHIALTERLMRLSTSLHVLKSISPGVIESQGLIVQEAFSQVESNEIEQMWADGIRRDAANALTVLYKLIPVLQGIRDTSIDIRGDMERTIAGETK